MSKSCKTKQEMALVKSVTSVTKNLNFPLSYRRLCLLKQSDCSHSCIGSKILTTPQLRHCLARLSKSEATKQSNVTRRTQLLSFGWFICLVWGFSRLHSYPRLNISSQEAIVNPSGRDANTWHFCLGPCLNAKPFWRGRNRFRNFPPRHEPTSVRSVS